MSCKHPVIPQLPREVIQHIYSITEPHEDHELVLSLKDRLRALAVCRTWRVYLDPKAWWPEATLVLRDGCDDDLRIVNWITTLQPAIHALETDLGTVELLLTLMSINRTALLKLFLSGEGQVLQDSLTAVRLFPRLQSLALSLGEREGQINLGDLWHLSALEDLDVTGWERVDLRGGSVLPQLTTLYFEGIGSIGIDASLPRLQQMRVYRTGSLALAGAHLHLPQLSQLSLYGIQTVVVDWPALPQLASLAVLDCLEVTCSRLAAMQHLTSLTLGPSWEDACAMLLAAPATVQHLVLEHCSDDWTEPPDLGAVPHVTSLASGSLDIIPHLGPLTQLQHLEFPWHPATGLAAEHIDWLGALATITRLSFGAKVDRTSAVDRRMQVLGKVLPAQCILEQPLKE